MKGRTDPEIVLYPVLDRVAVLLKEQVQTLLDLDLLLDKQVMAVARSALHQVCLISQLWPWLSKGLATVENGL